MASETWSPQGNGAPPSPWFRCGQPDPWHTEHTGMAGLCSVPSVVFGFGCYWLCSKEDLEVASPVWSVESRTSDEGSTELEMSTGWSHNRRDWVGALPPREVTASRGPRRPCSWWCGVHPSGKPAVEPEGRGILREPTSLVHEHRDSARGHRGGPRPTSVLGVMALERAFGQVPNLTGAGQTLFLRSRGFLEEVGLLLTPSPAATPWGSLCQGVTKTSFGKSCGHPLRFPWALQPQQPGCLLGQWLTPPRGPGPVVATPSGVPVVGPAFSTLLQASMYPGCWWLSHGWAPWSHQVRVRVSSEAED
ncbi:uncharacterized protein LOC141583967 [Saimiri boliviensis]|uniref:uncharacterized protein LOC141583967 n=1 Tax=Saimiri boliviensis TaxID=27679 RepID=UPI003D77DB36